MWSSSAFDVLIVTIKPLILGVGRRRLMFLIKIMNHFSVHIHEAIYVTSRVIGLYFQIPNLPPLKETLTPDKNKILGHRIYTNVKFRNNISGFARRIFLGRRFLKAVERFLLSPIKRETQCLYNIWKVIKKANSNVLAYSCEKLHTKADEFIMFVLIHAINMMLCELNAVIMTAYVFWEFLAIDLDKYCGENI